LIGSAAAAASNIGMEFAFASRMDTRKQEALPSDPKGLDWRRPLQKELTGLFVELAAFNERISELTKQGHQSLAMDVLKAQAISLAAQIDELRCILHRADTIVGRNYPPRTRRVSRANSSQ
jgi:hypothetical protein